jgi:hypothetical protein
MSNKHRCAMLAAAFTAGCSVWRPLPGGGLARPRTEQLYSARVALRDGTAIELDDATISSDSIVGFTGEPRARRAVARREVTAVETLQGDGTKSFAAGGLVTLSFFGALVIWVAVALGGD